MVGNEDADPVILSDVGDGLSSSKDETPVLIHKGSPLRSRPSLATAFKNNKDKDEDKGKGGNWEVDKEASGIDTAANPPVRRGSCLRNLPETSRNSPGVEGSLPVSEPGSEPDHGVGSGPEEDWFDVSDEDQGSAGDGVGSGAGGGTIHEDSDVIRLPEQPDLLAFLNPTQNRALSPSNLARTARILRGVFEPFCSCSKYSLSVALLATQSRSQSGIPFLRVLFLTTDDKL